MLGLEGLLRSSPHVGTMRRMHNIIIDCQDPQSKQEAFIICRADWTEKSCALGESVFDWREMASRNGKTWCFSPAELRANRPGDFSQLAVYGVLQTAQAKGYAGPATLPGVAEWAGVDMDDADLSSPYGRCRVMVAIMRSRRIGTV